MPDLVAVKTLALEEVEPSGEKTVVGAAPDPEGVAASPEALRGALNRLRSWRDGGGEGGS